MIYLLNPKILMLVTFWELKHNLQVTDYKTNVYNYEYDSLCSLFYFHLSLADVFSGNFIA